MGATAGTPAGGSGGASAAAGSGATPTGPKPFVVPVAQCTAAHDQMLYQTHNDDIRNISSNCAAGKIMGPSGENCGN
jgi:hypothetical protein